MKKITLFVAAAVSLSACSLSGGDLSDWMAQAQEEARNNVRPAEVYTLAKSPVYVDPVINGLNVFDAARVRPSQQVGVNTPDPNRVKEVLEDFSLEKLRYAGNIFKGNTAVALVEAENHTYTVRVGNYMGQNHGRVVAIKPDHVLLEEWVEDTYGEWQKRPACLPSPCPDGYQHEGGNASDTPAATSAPSASDTTN